MFTSKLALKRTGKVKMYRQIPKIETGYWRGGRLEYEVGYKRPLVSALGSRERVRWALPAAAALQPPCTLHQAPGTLHSEHTNPS